MEFGNISTAITSKYDSANLASAAQAAAGTSASTLITPATLVSALQANPGVFLVDTGAVNALVITPNPAITAYAAGQRFRVKIALTNTSTAVTINVNGLGAKNILNPNLSVPSLGSLLINAIVTLVYDGTQFQINSGQVSSYSGALQIAPPTTTSTSLTVSNGSATTVAVAVGTDPGTGLFAISAGNLGVATGGTLRLTVSAGGVFTMATQASGSSTLQIAAPTAGGNALQLPPGTVGTPTLNFTGSLGTGIFSSATDTINLVTAGNSRLQINSTGDITARGVAVVKNKAADTSRNTNIVRTDDPDLVIALAASTAYRVEAMLLYTSTSATPGFSVSANYTGTIQSGVSNANEYILEGVLANGTALAASNNTIGNPGAATSAATSISGLGILRISGVLVTNVAGNFSISWAQTVSNATNVTLQLGSYLSVVKLS